MEPRDDSWTCVPKLLSWAALSVALLNEGNAGMIPQGQTFSYRFKAATRVWTYR